jgi:hypothetical protein
VQVRVVQQVLPPGMEHGEKADAGAQMLGVACDGEQRFGGGAEQNVVNHLFVEKGDFRDLRGHGKDDVKVFDRQQFGLPAFEPLCALRPLAFGAVAVPAGVVSVSGGVAAVAFFEVATERRRTADLDGPHDAQLL